MDVFDDGAKIAGARSHSQFVKTITRRESGKIGFRGILDGTTSLCILRVGIRTTNIYVYILRLLCCASNRGTAR